MMHKTILTRICLPIFCLTLPLTAQESEEPVVETWEIQEITVTAQKRSEKLQETPLAVSAVDEELIENYTVADLRDLSRFTPSLVVGGSAAFEYPIAMRGISSAVSGIGADTPVAIYVDGVYLGRPSSAIFELVDVERVEVLRGPQGTLYGRNATGGAINIITKKPKEHMELQADLLSGSYNNTRVRAAITNSLVPGKLSGSFSGVFNERDGWGHNMTDDQKLNGEGNFNVRGSLRYTPSDNHEWLLRVDAGESEDFNAGKDNSGLFIKELGDRDTFFINEEPFGLREYSGISLTSNHQLSESISLTTITAWRENEHEFFIDSDGTPLQLARLHQAPEEQEQTSFEVQLSGSRENLDWLVGYYHFQEDSKTNILIDLFGPGVRLGTYPTNETNSNALFSQATWHATDRLNVTGGLRFSKESKDFTNSAANPGVIGTTPSAARAVAQSNSWDSFTPKLTFDWRLNEDFMLYTTYSEGFKSGGFNFLSNEPAFDPEELNAYEIGLKSDLLNRKLRLNVTAFTYDYQDLQVRIPGAPGVVFIQNAAEATVDGLEVEGAARPTMGWDFRFNFALLDAAYDTYDRLIRDANGDPVIGEDGNPLIESLAGNKLNRAPKTKGGISAQYSKTGSGGMFSGFLSYNFSDELFFTEINEELGKHDGWDKIDARLSYTFFNGLTLSAFGNNITDERHNTHMIPIGPWKVTMSNIGRTYGLELSFKR